MTDPCQSEHCTAVAERHMQGRRNANLKFSRKSDCSVSLSAWITRCRSIAGRPSTSFAACPRSSLYTRACRRHMRGADGDRFSTTNFSQGQPWLSRSDVACSSPKLEHAWKLPKNWSILAVEGNVILSVFQIRVVQSVISRKHTLKAQLLPSVHSNKDVRGCCKYSGIADPRISSWGTRTGTTFVSRSFM